MLIDSHCHLDPQYFREGAGGVIDRAAAVGVDGFVCIGVGPDLGAARHAIGLADSDARVFATVGIHPHDASTATDTAVTDLVALAAHPRVVAIGEIGLDYHYDHSPRQQQRDTFRRLIGVARAIGKPIVVHTREASADTLAILAEERAVDVGGIIHCFSEDLPFAKRALDLGFDLSFSGIVTFKNARSVQEVAAWAPADRILIETDSPYLAPVPVRGKPCEPAYLVHTATYLARLRGIAVDELAAATTRNTIRRLGLDGVGSREPTGT